jgi:serine/threonine-protein kinase
VANGVVYVGSLDNNVYALNARTGDKLWSYTTGNIVQPSPAVVNGVVYVGSYDYRVYAFGLKKGREKPEAASKTP